MFSDRLIFIITLLLSSIGICIMLDSFYGTMILLVDLFWLSSWMTNSSENSSLVKNKMKWSKRPLLVGFLIFLAISFVVQVKMNDTDGETLVVSLLAILPLVLLSQVSLTKEGS